MLVLHEGLIPSSKVYKICVLKGKEDIKILDYIFDKGIELIKYNPNSLPFVSKYSNKDIVYDFLKQIVLSEDNSGYCVLSCYDKDMELVGASLVSWGSPWYAPTSIQVINEECTVAFKRGVGLARALAHVLEKTAKDKGFKLVMFSNANLPDRKMLENTYEKHLGYSSYKTFYKEII